MFTGIVESAIISSIEVQETGWTLAVTSASTTARVKLGDSVAIDGACLSVINFLLINLVQSLKKPQHHLVLPHVFI